MTLPNDRQVAAWLADDAHEAPPDSLARALAATRRTRKRPRWTFPERWIPVQPTAFAKLGVTAVAVAAVGLVGVTLLRQPSVGPAASASPVPSSPPSAPSLSPLTERFDSTLNQISVNYPSGWQVRPATVPWTDRFVPGFNSATSDVIFDPALGDRLYLVLTSTLLDGRSMSEWHDQGFMAWPRALCPGTEITPRGVSHEDYTLDGAQGYVFGSGCGGGGAGRYGVELATASRGYVIYLYFDSESPQTTYDRAWFEAFLETVDLRPEPAP